MTAMKFLESKSEKYPPRTYHNAGTADLTVAFAEDFTTYGEELTKKAAGEKYIAIHLQTDVKEAARALYRECRKRGVKKLNVAGNGIYSLVHFGWTDQSLNQYIYDVLGLVHTYLPFESIISGGQTGVDFAGGVAGEVFGLDCEMTFPKGFKQRNIDNVDITSTVLELQAVLDNFVSQIEVRDFKSF